MEQAPEILTVAHLSAAWDAHDRLAAVGSHATDDQTHVLWCSAVEALDHRQLAEARVRFLQVIERDPACADGYLGLLRTMRCDGRSEGDCIELALALALVAPALGIEQQRSSKAIYQRYIPLSEHQHMILTADDARLALVAAAIKKGNLMLARAWLDALDEPNNPIASILRGKLHLVERNNQQALDAFVTAARQEPLATSLYCDSLLGRGLAHCAIDGDDTYAEQTLRDLLALASRPKTKLIGHHALGRLYERGNDLEHALHHLDAALQIRPDHQVIRETVRAIRSRQVIQPGWELEWRLMEIEFELEGDPLAEKFSELEGWEFSGDS